MNIQETEYKKYVKSEVLGIVRLVPQYKPAFYDQLEKLLKSLEQSKTFRTAELRSKKLRLFISDHVFLDSDFRFELQRRINDSYAIAVSNFGVPA